MRNKIPGNHPLILEYNQLIERLNTIESGIRTAQEAEPEPIPQYQITGVDYYKKTGELRILRELTNKVEKDLYVERWGQISGIWYRVVHSAAYKLIEGDILAEAEDWEPVGSGGYRILNVPTHITQAEWKDMIAGVIPERLLVQY